MILHVLLYALLCLVPALVLLPLRILDRHPRNEITDEQDPRDGIKRRGDAETAAA